MQCNAMQCNAMQCNAIQYNTIQYNTILHVTHTMHSLTINIYQKIHRQILNSLSDMILVEWNILAVKVCIELCLILVRSINQWYQCNNNLKVCLGLLVMWTVVCVYLLLKIAHGFRARHWIFRWGIFCL